MVSFPAATLNTKQQLGKERVCWLTCLHPGSVRHEGKSRLELKQSRSLETGTEAETREERCFLACSSWLAPPAFLHNSGLSSAQELHLLQWAEPFYIN